MSNENSSSSDALAEVKAKLAETLGGVAAGAVRHVLGKLLLDGNVVLEESESNSCF